MEEISKDILTLENEGEFQLRLLKEEGVGLFTTASKKSYLILDSIDFWYDLIQSRYPGKTKCKCKNEWFRVRFDYIPRPGTKDIRKVNIITKCTACFAEKMQFSVDIKYSPTEQLIDNPISYCEQPVIKYELNDINCYWTNADLKKILSFLVEEQKANIFCWFWQWSDSKRHFEKVSLEKAYEIITINHQYLYFYFSKINPILNSNLYNDGIYMEGDQWRRQEMIELSSSFIMDFGQGKKGQLFYVKFSTQYIEGGKVFDKSDEFKDMADNIMLWFKENYVEIRGKNCFDNKEEHLRIFGDRYLKKQKAGK